LIQTIKHLQQKNEQLKAQVARIPDICKWWYGWSCTAYQSDEMKCPHCCPNWEGDNKYAVYHNPADVEVLRKIKDCIKQWNESGIADWIDEIERIADKAIGGGKDE